MSKTNKNSVLVVDDESANIVALSQILESDYTVFAVKNGQTAVKVAEQQLPDLILLDIIMPEMDGYDVIAELKRSEITRNIPVIFITGLSNAADEEKGLSLGATDYISKPFSHAIVKLRVSNQINSINLMRLIIEKETAEKSSRHRSEFLSRMSHEMRTPMNAIMGMASLAKSAADTEKRDNMLEIINSASEQLLQLINDVLDVSDIEDNKFRLSCSEFSFSKMISGILDKVGYDAKKKQQSLNAEIDPAIPAALVGDEKRLAQVILNLLSNAIKFSHEHESIQINAFVRDTFEETITLQIEVIDNGIGMTAAQREKLFIPFEQADGGTDREYGGAGLGLTIANHIAELMGGGLIVESELGKGSTFTLTIKAQAKEHVTQSDSPIDLAGKRLLLVDDAEINREIVLAILEDTRLHISCAENGREALEMFSSDPTQYDAILMDVNMPVMDGVEATRRIRALDAPEGAQVPIIAMTANVLASYVEGYLAAGMNAHIGKPIDFDELLKKLNNVLLP